MEKSERDQRGGPETREEESRHAATSSNTQTRANWTPASADDPKSTVNAQLKPGRGDLRQTAGFRTEEDSAHGEVHRAITLHRATATYIQQ